MKANSATIIAELHQKLGRNLLRFQEIEFSLKFIMPYIHPDGGARGLDGWKAVKERVARKSLGPMIDELIESVQTTTPDFLAQEFKKVLEARNQIVHHLFQLPGVEIMTADGVRTAIAYLDRQFQETEAVYGLIKGQAAAVLCAVLDGPAYQDTEFAQYRETIDKALPPDVEVINLTDPTKTRWQNTLIVRLLRQAEAETGKRDGMTLLSRAGKFIRSQAPELKPKEYGLRRLTDVLVASGLFEVEIEPSRDGDSVTVLYRSKS